MDCREKVKSIFKYLVEVKKLDEKIIRSVNEYKKEGNVYWEYDFPKDTPLCKIDKSSKDGKLITVIKPKRKEPPYPPDKIKDYIITDFKDSSITPKYKEIIAVSKNGENIKFEDNEELVNEGLKWYKLWEVWALDDIKKKEVQNIYSNLFSLYQTLEVSEGNFELVYGNALLVWSIQGQKIMQPLLTTRIILSFDPKDGVFKFELIDENKIKFELDSLDNLDIPNRDKLLSLKRNIEDSIDIEDFNNFDDIDIRNIKNLEQILKCALNFMADNAGEVVLDFISQNEIKISDKPTVYNCPCIIKRKLNLKMQIEDLKDIIDSIEDGERIPKTISTLVSDKDDNSNSEKIEKGEADKNWKSVSENLLFPLAANEDQKEIARRLANNYGLVVQGPPGTGKSHTIANLICHLLANGKKVLVTSKTEKALKVLEEKIPTEISALCISLLGTDKYSLQKLSNSVRKIIEKLNTDPISMKKEIDIHKKDLDLCRREIARIMNDLKEFQVKLNKQIKYNGLEYSYIDIAKWVSKNECNLNYLNDDIDINAKNPLSKDEFNRLIYLNKNITKGDERKVKELLKYINKLPEAYELENKILKYKSLKQNDSLYKAKVCKWAIANNKKFDYSKALDNIDKCIVQINKTNKSWIKNLNKFYHESKFGKEMTIQLRDEINIQLDKVEKLIKDLNLVQIKGIELDSIGKFEEDFVPIYNKLINNEKLGFMFKIFNSKSNYILERVKINGKAIKTKDDAKQIKIFIDKIKSEELLISLWNTKFNEFGAQKIEKIDLATLQDIKIAVGTIDNIDKFKQNYMEPAIKSLGNISLPYNLDMFQEDGFNTIKDGIVAINKINEVDELKTYINSLKIELMKYDSLSMIIDGIDKLDIYKIREQYKEINRLKDVSLLVNELNAYMSKIKIYTPNFYSKLNNSRGEKIKYNNWSEAWKCSQWKTALKQVESKNIDSLEKKLEKEKNKEKYLIKELVAKQSWYSQIIRTTENQKRSLNSWQQAIGKIGKGTGKYANYYRKIAQKEMEFCKDAIPVWIMPSNKIIENLKLSNDLFDVVIFDESSQSDIFALQALFRAEKAVIVGDDKQISPQSVGVDRQKIYELINLNLKNQGVPHAEWFDLETSLYNTALRVFPNRLMLKEHFRCVPEIIQFSNNLSYEGEIIPLRYPKKEECINPPVVAVKVNGYRDEMKKENVVEAEAIVDKIVECCKDDKYSEMTMGVISLLGHDQSKLIDLLLREKLGEQEMVKRKIICGDAYSFQGDERDIIFMSLVIASNVRFAALTKEDDIKRFNVAASRARNQMWLFHSVELNDLNPDCVRYSLLTYCKNPGRIIDEVSKNETLFDSEFEKDVYKLLIAKNYSVTPQVWAGRYRIDLVVEGVKNKLAVECDGDKWHGIEKWEEDCARQEQLERVGWVFVRIRGSEFYRDRNKAMNKVWEKLDEMGIEKGIKIN